MGSSEHIGSRDKGDLSPFIRCERLEGGSRKVGT